MADWQDYARATVSGVSDFFGWDTPNDESVITPPIPGRPVATGPLAQPQTVAPAGEGGPVMAGVPSWVWIAGALAAGVVVLAVVLD